MKVGESFKRADIQEKYDVIIIGSGIGGLGAAALLAKEGKKVLVLEKHYVAGGFTHVFKRKDYEWDVGIHYIGEVNREHSFLKDLFNDVTNGNLKWAEMDEVYDRIVFGDEIFDFVKGKEEFVAKLKSYFPEEERTIDEYINLVYQAARSAKSFFSERAMIPWLGNIAGLFLKSKFLKYSDKTTLEVLQSLTSNKKLIAVLTGQYGDYGLPPAESSFAIHAMVVKHYLYGGAYPIGGCEKIAQTIAPIIEKAGGKIYVNAGVKQVIVEGGKAIGVKMDNGEEIFAKIIISDAGIINTYANLLDKITFEQFKLETKLSKVEHSTSHVCLYIGLKHSAKDLGIDTTNYWIYPHYDHDKAVNDYLADQSAPIPVTYISFPSVKDPEWEQRYPGKSTVEIVSVAPFEWFEQWEDKRWKKRGEDYEALKEKFAQRLLEELYKYKPQLKGKIDYYELSSPLSTKQFTYYEKGEIYGLNHSPERFRLKFLRAHTPIKNLFLTGQDVVTAGIGGALFGGLITASAVTGKNLVKKVQRRVEEMEIGN